MAIFPVRESAPKKSAPCAATTCAVVASERLTRRHAAGVDEDGDGRVIHEAVADTGMHVAHAPVMMEGRVELLWYVREQSISLNYHRYGNLGPRAGETRADVF